MNQPVDESRAARGARVVWWTQKRAIVAFDFSTGILKESRRWHIERMVQSFRQWMESTT